MPRNWSHWAEFPGETKGLKLKVGMVALGSSEASDSRLRFGALHGMGWSWVKRGDNLALPSALKVKSALHLYGVYKEKGVAALILF